MSDYDQWEDRPETITLRTTLKLLEEENARLKERLADEWSRHSLYDNIHQALSDIRKVAAESLRNPLCREIFEQCSTAMEGAVWPSPTPQSILTDFHAEHAITENDMLMFYASIIKRLGPELGFVSGRRRNIILVACAKLALEYGEDMMASCDPNCSDSAIEIFTRKTDAQG